MYKLAIFDMDGTILDTLQDIMNATNFALEKNGFSYRTYDEIRQFVGNGIYKLIERACPVGCDEQTIKHVYEDFIPYYEEHSADNTKSYDGIVEVLKSLRSQNIKTAVNSNKIDSAVKDLCVKYFKNLFDYEFGSREGIPNKPAPNSVNEILKMAQIEKQNAVYIGDSDVDYNTAKNAGVDFIGVDWGFRGKEFLKNLGVEKIVEKPQELLNVFKK